jgi:hypothetical protein
LELRPGIARICLAPPEAAVRSSFPIGKKPLKGMRDVIDVTIDVNMITATTRCRTGSGLRIARRPIGATGETGFR